MELYEAFKPVEPYFLIISTSSHFLIICTSMEFDDTEEKQKPLKEKILVIEKSNKLKIYERQKQMDDFGVGT